MTEEGYELWEKCHWNLGLAIWFLKFKIFYRTGSMKKGILFLLGSFAIYLIDFFIYQNVDKKDLPIGHMFLCMMGFICAIMFCMFMAFIFLDLGDVSLTKKDLNFLFLIFNLSSLKFFNKYMASNIENDSKNSSDKMFTYDILRKNYKHHINDSKNFIQTQTGLKDNLTKISFEALQDKERKLLKRGLKLKKDAPTHML